MPSQSSRSGGSGAESAAERIRELNERIIEAGKQAGEAYLDTYERALKSIADYQESLADASGVEWVATLARAQASFTRELADAYVSAARGLGGRATEWAESAARQARRMPVPGGDEAEARGAAASEEDLPIPRYDDLTAEQVTERLPGLSQAELAKVEAYERRNANRSTVLDRVGARRGPEPWPGYDEQTVEEIRKSLSGADDDRRREVGEYERRHKDRSSVLRLTDGEG